MPISNRTDKNTLRTSLAISETSLKKGSDGIETAEKAHSFTPEDQAVLDKAKDVLLNARIGNEFPIVARLLDDMVKRVEGGEKLEWTPEQTKGFLSLVGDLSFAENDVLHKLAGLGVIPDQQWDAFVKPHQDITNLSQTSTFRKAKWGMAAMGGMLPTMVMGYGIVIAVGGPLGALAALTASTTFALTAGKKIQNVVSEKAFVENATLGVNASQGKEVTSEPMLLAARAAEGDLVLSKEGSLLDRLKQEVALGEMIVTARASSGVEIQPLEQPFISIGAKYLEGLAPIAEKLEKGQITEIEARKEIMGVRAQALDAKALDGVAKLALATYVNYPQGQKLVYVRQLSDTAQHLVDDLKKNGGVASDDMRSEAAAMLQIYSMAKGELGKLDLPSLQILAKVVNKVPLDAAALKDLQTGVADQAKNIRDQMEPELKATSDVAVKQAKLAFEVLWGTVVPSFNEIKEQPTAKGIQARALPEGGFEVSGKFHGGILKFLGLTSEGNFKVKIDDAGRVDPESMKIDLGPKFAKFAGGKALETWAKGTGIGKGAAGVEVDDKKTADGRYTVRGEVGSMRGKVEVSAMGMVAWDTMKVG